MREERWHTIVKEERVARLATHTEQNRIHLVPVCYTYNGKDIFIGTSINSKKVKNLQVNSDATLLIDIYQEDWSKLKGVMIQGRGEVIKEGKEFEEAKKQLYEKYPQYQKYAAIEEGESAIIKITPEKIISWDYES